MGCGKWAPFSLQIASVHSGFVMDLADDSGDPPPAVNWSLVDDDQDWRRREGSKSAPPMLNVSGFPGPKLLWLIIYWSDFTKKAFGTITVDQNQGFTADFFLKKV